MNGRSNRRAAATVAALLACTLPAGAAFGAKQAAGSSIGGGSQRVPGGIVTDRSGGSYDPNRSVYIQHASLGAGGAALAAPNDALGALRARSIALNRKYGLGAYALGSPAAIANGDDAHGFSWGDASVGATAGAGAILVLAGAAFVTVRWRRRPVL